MEALYPKKEQVVHEERRQTLESYPVGTKIRIARVLDEKELLDYLVTIDVNIDETYEITAVPITAKCSLKLPFLYKRKGKDTIYVVLNLLYRQI